MTAARAVRSHAASTTPTDSMTFTARADPACISMPTTTTRSTADVESRRAEAAMLLGTAPRPWVGGLSDAEDEVWKRDRTC